jgi:hypothetical protein
MKYNLSYAKLLSIENTNGGDRDSIIYKRAVLLSNRSNCLFEMAKYDKSTEDARKCLDLLDGICKNGEDEESSPSIQFQCNSLRWKNLLRIARCGIYGGDIYNTEDNSTAYDKKILEPLQVLEQCGDAAYEKRAKRMLEQVRALRAAAHDRSGVDNHSDAMPLPSILRASLFGSWIREYYTYGHDVVTSALESGYLNEEGVPACPAIELSKLPDEHLSNLSFLFGGVGDARHVYTTLCDVGKQWNELSDAKKAKFRLKYQSHCLGKGCPHDCGFSPLGSECIYS